VSANALGRTTPGLFVIKKNGRVLAKLFDWLKEVGPAARGRMPALVIDDEADLASPNTGGTRWQADDGDDLDDDERDDTPPSRINEMIRNLLLLFRRRAYIAYTATPFANVLIDYDAIDRISGRDLYPRSFIVDLPKPPGYYGAERMFG